MTLPRALLIIIVLSTVVRLGAFFVASSNLGEEGFVQADAIVYVELARNLVHGVGFMSTIEGELVPEVFRTPGFPLLLVPFMYLPSGVLAYSFFMSVLAGILLPLITYLLGKKLSGERAALFAAGLIAFEPHAVFYSFLLQTEVPFMLFGLGGLLAAYMAYERSSYGIAALSGALFGYAAFIRPGLFPIFIVIALCTTGFLALSRDTRYRHTLAMLLVFVAFLMPWHLRNQAVTGSFALSGQGWRNVYTDYLASIRSLDRGTPYHEEKENLKVEALPRFGIPRAGVNDPANAAVLRNAALSEMWEHKMTVAKLETMLLVTFFFNDGYYYEFRHLGYLADDSRGQHISPTYEILNNGIAALPSIMSELSRQAWIPLWGRLFTLSTFVLAIVGFFLMKSRMRYIFAAAIALFALTSTAIGLGLDARLRVPIEPLLFILASVALVWIIVRVRTLYG